MSVPSAHPRGMPLADLVDRIATWLGELLATRGNLSLRGILLLLGAGSGAGIVTHSLVLDELGLVKLSGIGLVIVLAAVIVCSVAAIRDLKPARR